MDPPAPEAADSESVLIAKERRIFRWTCAWGTLGTILWLSRTGYLFWAQKQLRVKLAKPAAPYADILACLDEIQKKAGVLQAAKIVAGILFLVCFVRWILAIRKRRALAE